MIEMIEMILFILGISAILTYIVLYVLSLVNVLTEIIRKIIDIILVVIVVLVIVFTVVYINMHQNEINERKALAEIEYELKELNYSVKLEDYLVKLTDFAKNNDTSITKYEIKYRGDGPCIDYAWIDVMRCKKENNNENICVPDKIQKCREYRTYWDSIVVHGKWKSFKERDSAMNAWIKSKSYDNKIKE